MKIYATKEYEIPDDGDCERCKSFIEGRGGFGDRPPECTLFDANGYRANKNGEMFYGKRLARCKRLKDGDKINIL